MKFNKQTKILLLVAVVVCAAGIGIPVTKRAYQEFREHITFRPVKNLPESNGIPRMYLTTDSGLMITSREKWVHGTYRLVDGTTEVVSGGTKIKGHGHTTWDKPKKAYTIKLDKEISLLGMPSDKRWVLRNPYNDKSLLRDDFALHLGNTIYKNIAWTPHCRDIEVLLNGKFFGVYELAEIPKLAKHKVNVPDISNVKKLSKGGYLLEIGRKKNEYTFTTPHGVVVCMRDPDKDISTKAFALIQQQVLAFENALYSDNFTDSEAGYRNYFDVNSFIDWYLINEYTKNNDAKFKASVDLYYDPADKKFHFGPIWDFDISSGNIDYDGCQFPDGFWVKDAPWIARLFEDPLFVTTLKKRWNETKEQLKNTIDTYIPEHAKYLDQAQRWNFKAWRILDVRIWPNYVVPGSYQGEVDYLVNWLDKRYVWFDQAINQL